jgi:autotransporter-associated beta strand protein
LSTPTNTYFSGQILGETRKLTGGSNDAFITSAPLPLGAALRNKQLSLQFGTLSSGTTGISEMFKIDHVELSNAQYYVCFTNDHMLEITNGATSYEQVAPLRRFTTTNSFEIALSASAQQISPLPDLSLGVNSTSAPIAFTFGNLGTNSGTSLQVLADSSNPTLLPPGALAIGGSGTSRTLTITPATDQSGTAAVTVSVTDGAWTNSRTFSLSVNNFFVAATPGSRSIAPGASTSFTVTVTTNSGFSGSVSLGAAGLPGNVSAGFSPSSLSGAGSSTFSITTSNTTPSGDYTLTLIGTNGSLTSSTNITLSIIRSAANIRWASTNNPEWDVTNLANWFNPALGTLDQFYNGDTVLFDDTPFVVTNINLASGIAVSPAAMTNDSSANNFAITGAGKISGAANLVKKGSSTLTLGTANDFTGNVTVLGGILKAADAGALGSTGAATIVTNGGTLDVNGLNFTAEPVTASGAGAGGKGAIVNTGPQQTSALRNVTLAGDVTFGGTGRWDIRAASTSSTNGCSLLTGGQPYKITKVGTNQFSLVAVSVDLSLGDIDVKEGVFAIQTVTSQVGSSLRTITVFPGATLNLWNLNTAPLNKQVVLSNNATIWNESGTSITRGNMILWGDATFNIGGTSLTLSNGIQGVGRLIKTGAGTLNLALGTVFFGNTVINGGTLALIGGGSLTGCSNIVVGAGTTLSATGRLDGKLLVPGGQVLSGDGTVLGNVDVSAGATISPGASIGALTISNALSLRGTTFLELNKAGVTNDVIKGAASISYGGTLQLTNLAGALAAGDSFKLFYSTSYGGAFTNFVPPMPGSGLAWNTNTLTADGTLRVAIAPRPVVNSLAVIGGQLVASGTNGVWNANYYVLTTTNLALPLAQWTPLATNMFSASGAFSFTNSPAAPQQFYVLQLP